MEAFFQLNGCLNVGVWPRGAQVRRTLGVRLSADSSKKTRQALRRWARRGCCYVLSSRHEDLDAGLVVALQQSEQLPGDDPLQAALDVSRALALGGPSGGVGAGLEVIAQADQRDGVQRLVELPVAATVQAMAGDLAGGGGDRAGPGPGG